jgi:hypothetical protein
MPLQLRRGNTAQINAIVPLIGELIYDTQEGKIRVGNGTTAGGVVVSSYTDTQAKAAAGAALAGGSHGGINFTYNSGTNTIDANLNYELNRTITNLDGTVTLVDTDLGTITGPLNTPGGTITGNLLMTRSGYSSVDGAGFEFAQHHSTADAVNFSFYRSRGTRTAQLAVQNADDIADIIASAYHGTGRSAAASITFRVDGALNGVNIPGKIIFATNNGTSFSNKGEIDADGILRINQIQAFTTASIQFNSLISGDISGSVFGDDSTRILDGTNNRLTARSVQATQYFQAPVYANVALRNAGITAPTPGMIAFITNNGSGQQKLQVYTTGGGWVDLH